METVENNKDHNIIYLQDEAVQDEYEGVTWCSEKIDNNDTKYIKVDCLKKIIDDMIEKYSKKENFNGIRKQTLTELKKQLNENNA